MIILVKVIIDDETLYISLGKAINIKELVF